METFVLQHVRDPDGDDDVKLLGVYSSRLAVEEAIQRYLQRPGFSDHPNGFHVAEYPLDKDHWVEGFVTIDQEHEL